MLDYYLYSAVDRKSEVHTPQKMFCFINFDNKKTINSVSFLEPSGC